MNTHYDFKKAQEEAVSTAETFYKLYYETMDKKRQLVARLYMDEAVLVWNGNFVKNAPEIQKFYEDFPNTTHLIMSCDAQPVNPLFVGEQRTFLVQTSGSVRESAEKSSKFFTQSFVITQQGEKWKIFSDTFRYQQINKANS